ncbi:MAG: non-homologous end-joining DNA ligase [Acidimicrobiales bacterium]
MSRSVGPTTKPTTPLSEYRAKRNPKKTPEPMGTARRSRNSALAKPTFVIQEHHARALHWDFRLEHDGVLVSWALPKGLPLNPATNHLAVRTEDHPLKYGSFAGTIPKGEYGAGTVSIWDHGWYELEKWREKEVMIVLHGQRVTGRYVLFPTGEKNWMIHRMDPAPANYEPMPQHVAPMLVLASHLPKSDEGWAYEFKWDGVRAMVYVEGGRVRALTRNDKQLTTTFPELREIGEFLGARSAILDGEIVTLDKEGRPSFAVLAHRLHLASSSAIERLAKTTPVSFFAFDLLYLDGHNYLSDTYDTRRAALSALRFEGRSFATPPSSTNVKGSAMLRIAKERGLEGVVVKRRSSRYAPGQRNGEWIKIKNFHTQEVVIGGWTDGQGERADSFGALLLGIHADEGFTFIGKVGTGFSATDRRELLAMLKPLARKTSPFVERLSPRETAVAHFVRPSVVGEVRFAEWTDDGHLRQPSWRGLRTDKSAKEVVREP